MDDQIANLIQEIKDLESSAKILGEKQFQLAQLQQACHHVWSQPKRRSKYTEGYLMKGDRPGSPGYGGVDRQFDCHVPPKTEVWWERECSNCSKIAKTTKTKPTGEVPVF